MSNKGQTPPALDVPAGSLSGVESAAPETVACEHCAGTGWRSVGWNNSIPCRVCDGTGTVRISDSRRENT